MTSDSSRRQFLRTGSAVAGSLLAARTVVLEPQPLGAAAQSGSGKKLQVRHHRCRHGGLGPAASAALTLPGVECVGAADLYDGRHIAGAGDHREPQPAGHAPLPGTARPQGRRLHSRRRARPLAQARGGGRLQRRQGHLLREADVAHRRRKASRWWRRPKRTTASCRSVRSASARRSAPRPASCITQGAIGEVEMVELSLGRNDPDRRVGVSAAARSVSAEPGLGHLAERCAEDPLQSRALRALALLEGVRHGRRRRPDGAPHQRHACSRSAGMRSRARRRPWAASSAGRTAAICRTCTSCCSTITASPSTSASGLGTETPELARFMGPKGILDATEFDLTLLPAARRRHGAQLLLGQLPGEDARGVRQAVACRARRRRPARSRSCRDAVYRGDDWDDLRPHLWNFFQAVKTRKPVVEDAVFGNHAAIACHMANESYFRKKTVYWDEKTRSIST